MAYIICKYIKIYVAVRVMYRGRRSEWCTEVRSVRVVYGVSVRVRARDKARDIVRLELRLELKEGLELKYTL